MPTVESVARAALGDLAVDQNHVLNGERWVNDRLREYAGSIRLKQLRRMGELTIAAVVTAGTVTVTQNSTTVTGDATAVAAWSNLMSGRYFQIDRIWYRINATDLSNSIIYLDEPYAGATASAQTYRIVQRFALLPENVQSVVGFVHDRWNRELEQRSLPWLDLRYPERLYMLGGPRFVTDIGEDLATRRKQVELYPYSSDAEHIRFGYYANMPYLTLDDPIPASLDPNDLKEGVLIDVMRWQMARAYQAGQADIGNSWRNEYRAQETKWGGIMAKMTKTDGVLDDLAWISKFGGTSAPSDITTARDEVFARARRP